MADKTIRVNDPLTVGGYTFHQNGFGPAPDVVIRDAGGQAAVDRADPDDRLGGRVPARRVRGAGPRRRAPAAPPAGDRRHGDPADAAVPLRWGRTPTARPTSSASSRSRWPAASPRRPTARTSPLELRGFSRLHAADRQEGPGAGDRVGGVRVSLIVGIVISFWLPRRRVWGRLDRDGRLSLVMRADRYVDAGREFGRLLDDLVASRRAGPPGGTPASPAPADLAADLAADGRARTRQPSQHPGVPGPQHRRWNRLATLRGTGQTRVDCPCHRRLPRFVEGPRRDSVPASIPRR